MNTSIRYLLIVVLFAIGGALVGESIISSVNILEIILGVILLITAVVLLLRASVRRANDERLN